MMRGVSASKEDVHNAIKNIDKGIFPKAFCKIIPDILGGDPEYCNIMHADGAGTKSSLAYMYWKETGDLSVWKGIAQDALIMNIDDLLCVGAVGLLRLEEAAGRLMHGGGREHGRMGRVVLAVTLHNLPEGMVVGLAAALALRGEPEAVSGALALALGIGLQNIPEGAAVSLPLAQAGQGRRKAFCAGAASGLVEPLGALLALALAGWVSAALPWLMSAAAGCMVCVTAQEMIPEAVGQDEPAGVISVVLGFALMMALDIAL